MKQIKLIVREGQMIPKGYGVAYLNIDSFSAVAYPIPLNLVVGAVRKVWFKMKNPEQLYKTGYDNGYMRGKEDGRKYAFNQYKRQAIDHHEPNNICRMEADQNLRNAMADIKEWALGLLGENEPDREEYGIVQSASIDGRAKLRAEIRSRIEESFIK